MQNRKPHKDAEIELVELQRGASLNDLPEPILLSLAESLNTRDLVSLVKTSRRFHTVFRLPLVRQAIIETHIAKLVECNSKFYKIFCLDLAGRVWENKTDTMKWTKYDYAKATTFFKRIPHLSNICQIKQDIKSTLFLDTSGTVWGYGKNKCGELGLGHQNQVKSPTRLQGLPKIKQIEMLNFSTYLLDDSGAVFVCGSNHEGKLPIPKHYQFLNKPRKLKKIPPIKQLTVFEKAGESCILFLDETNCIWKYEDQKYSRIEYEDQKYTPIQKREKIQQIIVDSLYPSTMWLILDEKGALRSEKKEIGKLPINTTHLTLTENKLFALTSPNEIQTYYVNANQFSANEKYSYTFDIKQLTTMQGCFNISSLLYATDYFGNVWKVAEGRQLIQPAFIATLNKSILTKQMAILNQAKIRPQELMDEIKKPTGNYFYSAAVNFFQQKNSKAIFPIPFGTKFDLDLLERMKQIKDRDTTLALIAFYDYYVTEQENTNPEYTKHLAAYLANFLHKIKSGDITSAEELEVFFEDTNKQLKTSTEFFAPRLPDQHYTLQENLLRVLNENNENFSYLKQAVDNLITILPNNTTSDQDIHGYLQDLQAASTSSQTNTLRPNT